MDSEMHELVTLVSAVLKERKDICREGPVLIFRWNEARLTALAKIYSDPKRQILNFIESHGGRQLLSGTENENFIYFKEPSHVYACKSQMIEEMIWAFSYSRAASEVIGCPYVEPVAKGHHVSKTRGGRVDHFPSDFFNI